jgi:F-type H+-transporting ATPase subunit alpha
MTAILFALGNGDLDDVEVSSIVSFESAFLSFLAHDRKSLVDALNEKMALTDSIVEDLNKAIADFKETGTW